MRAHMRWLTLLLLIGIGTVAVTHGADDDYLKALKAETQSIAPATAPAAAPAPQDAKGKQEWSADKQSMGEEVPPNLSKEQFEDALKTSFYGTYVFYMKLNDAGKAAVYSSYQSNGHISNIRDTTTNLLKK